MSQSNTFRSSFSVIRENRKLKLVDLARLAGISHSTISHWLSGNRDISTDTLSNLLLAADQLSPGALLEYSLLISGGGLQNMDQLGDMLHLLAGQFRRLKDERELQQVS